MELVQIKEIAIEVWNKLKPHCDICKIAGSIRREKPEPKDIEIVCLPKVVVVKNMFGEETGTARDPKFVEIVKNLGGRMKGNTDGKYMQILLKELCNLDLFMPDDFDYWRQFAIRTGSADWTARYIAGGWRNQGWCGSDAGLRLQTECVSKTSETDGKKSWKCIVAKDKQTLPPHWKSEEEFFAWIKLKWVEPKLRNI